MVFTQAAYRYLLCARVCMVLGVIVEYKTNLRFEVKMARQLLFIVANIKYRCLSNGGHPGQHLNRFGKFIQSLDRISETFFSA